MVVDDYLCTIILFGYHTFIRPHTKEDGNIKCSRSRWYFNDTHLWFCHFQLKTFYFSPSCTKVLGALTTTSMVFIAFSPLVFIFPFTSCSQGSTISYAGLLVLQWHVTRERNMFVWQPQPVFKLQLNWQTLLCKSTENRKIVTRWPSSTRNTAINHLSLDGELESEWVKGQHKVLYLTPLCAVAGMFSLGQQNNLAHTTKHIIVK